MNNTTTTTPEGRSFERLVGRLDPSKLHEVFSNVQPVPDDRFRVYRVLDQHGSEAGMLSHLGGHEWRAYVYNFPGQKKFFSWNLPSLTLAEFEAFVKRRGLQLVSTPEAEQRACAGPVRVVSGAEVGDARAGTAHLQVRQDHHRGDGCAALDRPYCSARPSVGLWLALPGQSNNWWPDSQACQAQPFKEDSTDATTTEDT